MMRRFVLLLAVGGLLSGCGSVECEASGVREVVLEFGERLKQVSLLAADSILVQGIREEYAPYITADLLESWTTEPDLAPGRTVSSPWPERIESR